ncbi:hypothetical protein T02_9538 [Trichinella nativa]|uniref:Uncharacterized protein n=1 Tax=Trichinella nativa TaxID=6335 RepID=A0A0V1KLK4_9BILA|nr:hypothetical protein T02_9538 [Trichinella nativa]
MVNSVMRYLCASGSLIPVTPLPGWFRNSVLIGPRGRVAAFEVCPACWTMRYGPPHILSN